MINLTPQQLFSPAPPTPAYVTSTAPGTDWLTKLMAVATRLQLPVTDWYSGGVGRTMQAVMAWVFSYSDALVSQMAQGGFLDYAATGTVTYVDPVTLQTVTIPVTVDQSINPGAPLGWLDLLMDSGYNVQRIPAAPGIGPCVITNTSSSSATFNSGTYHVANPVNSLTYSNVGSLTIAAASQIGGGIAAISNNGPATVQTVSAHGLSTNQYVTIFGVGSNIASPNGTWQVVVTGATTFLLLGSQASGAFAAGGTIYLAQSSTFQADIAGPGTSVGAPGNTTLGPNGSITTTVTTLPGVTVTNLVTLVGTPAESNVAAAARCKLKLAALSPNGAKAAYQYLATSAYLLANPTAAQLAAGAPLLISTPITQAIPLLNTANGTVSTVVRNAVGTGAVLGCTNLGITSVTNAIPSVITVASPHGLSSGNTASISGVQGATGVNGTWVITVTSPTAFAVGNTVAPGAYTQGGVVEGGDLGELDAFLQASCVPGAVTENTLSVTPVTSTVAATIYVSAAAIPQVFAAVVAALQAYASKLPIGGYSFVGTPANSVPVNELIGVIENSLSQINDSEGVTFTVGLTSYTSGQYIPVSPLGILSFQGANITLTYVGV
jgi:hypothetical protein